MNYDEQITQTVVSVKADKSIVQPWRNKAIARLEEAQAFVKMGKSITLEKPPEDFNVIAAGQTAKPQPTMQFATPNKNLCICPADMLPNNPLKDCPVHGGK